jgi:hypothetical protein
MNPDVAEDVGYPVVEAADPVHCWFLLSSYLDIDEGV